MYRESISENAKHLLRRMRTVTREAKLPRICCTVAEKSSVTLSSGIGFQFVNSNVTTRSRVISAPSDSVVLAFDITHLALVALPAYYAEQGLCNCTVSAVLSVPTWAHSSKVAAAGLLLWARRAEITTDCCMARAWQ